MDKLSNITHTGQCRETTSSTVFYTTKYLLESDLRSIEEGSCWVHVFPFNERRDMSHWVQFLFVFILINSFHKRGGYVPGSWYVTKLMMWTRVIHKATAVLK